MAQMDIFGGRIAHMLLVFNGVLCSTLMSTLIQLSDTIHYPYITKRAGMRTLKRYYHIGTIPADYDQRTYSVQSSWKHKTHFWPVGSIIVAARRG